MDNKWAFTQFHKFGFLFLWWWAESFPSDFVHYFSSGSSAAWGMDGRASHWNACVPFARGLFWTWITASLVNQAASSLGWWMDIKCRPPPLPPRFHLTLIRITIRILWHLSLNSNSRSFPSHLLSLTAAAGLFSSSSSSPPGIHDDH